MTRFRFRGSASMTLVLALAIIQTAIAQTPSPLAPSYAGILHPGLR